MERGFRAPQFWLAAVLAGALVGIAGSVRAPAQSPPSASPSPSASPATTANPAPAPATAAAQPTQMPIFPGVAVPPEEPPTAPPTQPPIIVDPASAAVSPDHTEFLHVMQVLGAVTIAVADPTIVDASIDQNTRILAVIGKKVGTTAITVTDSRGLTRQVPVRVALDAGSIPSEASVRITGHPATEAFLREIALAAATSQVYLRPGATISASTDGIVVHQPLMPDDTTDIEVPIALQGGDTYFNVSATTTVHVENFAQPLVRPQHLLVSDFPETLKENGVLFTADLSAKNAERFLYYHYNPAGQPDRRIVLHVQNPSPQPALVQFIAGTAGPGLNEMEVGHNATQRFLVHLAQNEGTVVTIPGNATANLLVQGLPARTVASGILQLHELEGADLHLTLVAQNASDSPDMPVTGLSLLEGDHPHARGIYPIPEFYFDYLYDAEGPDLEVPIGQIPLPNLVQGQTLAGDYGVLQSVTIRMVNNDRHNARDIAVYADPRGGRATGTFIIDRVLIQAHAMAPYMHYKLRQYTLPPGSFVRTEIVTMPEGGSSYPLRIVVGPDDGSPPPGAPDSLVY
jgi:hypothetical protein